MDTHYEVHTSNATHDPAWDAFLAGTPGGHHVQTSLWGQLKAAFGWDVARLVVTEAGRIVAGAQLLTRPLPLLGSVGYITKGPLCAEDEPALHQLVIAELLRLAEQRHVAYLIVEPPNNGASLAAPLIAAGFRCSRIEVAPTATLIMDLALDLPELLKRMKRQTRQNVLRAEREGITVREGSEQDLLTFYRLYLSTGRRQRFAPYPQEYFAAMWRILGAAGHAALLLAEYEGEAVSALLLIPFGDTVLAKTLGWSGEHGNRRPNEALFWAAVRWAKAHGYRRFDFEGLEPNVARAILDGQPLAAAMEHSPSFFKIGFGGQIVLCPPAYVRARSRLLRLADRQIIARAEHWPAAQTMLERFVRR
jgi:lipid II:glycine glycyltransferase (peptidoglycan interpeptide bridge formation enzyme)